MAVDRTRWEWLGVGESRWESMWVGWGGQHGLV